MTVRGIVTQWLKDNGYDGLYDDNHECGCNIEDLMNCCWDGDVIPDCRPGHKAPCTCGEGCDYHIVPEKT